MLIYKTVITPVDPKHNAVSWQASQTEASKARTMLKKMGYKPETFTVDIPTSKGPLLDWLNVNASK